MNQRFWESKAREVELAKPRRGQPITQDQGGYNNQ